VSYRIAPSTQCPGLRLVDEARSNGVVVTAVVDRCAPNRPMRRSDGTGDRSLLVSERFGRVHSWTREAARNRRVISSASRPYDTPIEKRRNTIEGRERQDGDRAKKERHARMEGIGRTGYRKGRERRKRDEEE